MTSNRDLTRAVESGSYKNESDERLRELVAGALDIGGRRWFVLWMRNAKTGEK